MARLTVLDDLASSQQGYFTRAQAALCSVDDAGLRRAVARGRLAAVARGIYRIPGAPEHRHEALYAAWMALSPTRTTWQRTVDPDALVFGRSALAVYEIGDLKSIEHEFIVPRLRRTRLPDVALRTRTWNVDDWRVVEGMPIARPEWVIAEGIRSGEDPGHMADALADARNRGLVDAGYLEARISQLGRSARRADQMSVSTLTWPQAWRCTPPTPSSRALRRRRPRPALGSARNLLCW